MPPIPIYTHSPINAAAINAAAKADGGSPQTAERIPDTNRPGPPPTTIQNSPYPAAQPGAPATPAPTGLPSTQQQYSPPLPEQPTRTQALGSQSPPFPQPGAFPVPFGAGPPQATATGLPPPPRAGESMKNPQPPPPQPTAPASYYPPQAVLPAPPAAVSQSAQRGTALAFGQAPAPPLAASEHPPGYLQNSTAAELDRYQRAAQEALERDEEQARRRPSLVDGGVVDGVWGSVKGAVAAAGGKIAAVEEEVWKRLSK